MNEMSLGLIRNTCIQCSDYPAQLFDPVCAITSTESRMWHTITSCFKRLLRRCNTRC